MRLRSLLTASLLFAAAPLAAQTTIGSTANADFSGPLGRDDLSVDPTVRAIAQTFVTPTGAPVLQSFSVLLADYFNGADLPLQGSVYAFGADRVLGSALYQSAVVAGSSAFDLTPLTFGGIGLTLTPGTSYAFVLSTFGAPDFSLNFYGTTATDSYAGGALYTSTATTAAGLASAGAFARLDGAPDAAFQAQFGAATSTVPEPSTYVLLATGLGTVGLIARRRRAA